MTRRTTLALIAITAVFAIIAIRSWMSSKIATVKLSESMSAQKSITDHVAVRERHRAEHLKKSVAAITRAKEKIKTPSEAAAAIPDILQNLPRPIPPLKLTESLDGMPDPPAIASIPQTDLKPLYDALQDCRLCQARLESAQQDLADEREKSAALESERDAAVRVAHIGAFWTRFTLRAKWVFIGAVFGAALARSSLHK